jgi:hypothetical protein
MGKPVDVDLQEYATKSNTIADDYETNTCKTIRAGEGFIPRFIGDFPDNPKGREQTLKKENSYGKSN